MTLRPPRRHNQCIHHDGRPFRPPQSVLDDRDRRLAMPETIEMWLLGDPPPGRSALDQRTMSDKG
jgi:hypothetical protein